MAQQSYAVRRISLWQLVFDGGDTELLSSNELNRGIEVDGVEGCVIKGIHHK